MERQPITPEPESDHDRIFTDPALAQTAAEDPLFRFLSNRWKQVLLVLGAILAGYFGNQAFQETTRNSMKRAGELFSSLHQQISQLDTQQSALDQLLAEQKTKLADPKLAEKDKTDLQKKVSDSEAELKRMQDRAREIVVAMADTRPPYSQIAAIYRGILAAKSGDLKGAEEGIGAAANWQALKAEDPARFLAEGAAFRLAGLLLDQAGNNAKGLELLRSLATEGAFVAVSAAIRFATLANTDQLRSEALSILEKVRERFPENSSLIEPEIKRLS